MFHDIWLSMTKKLISYYRVGNDMAMFLSVAKIFRPLKSTEHIYEVILINTQPRHVKSGADLHGKENVILVDFFF